MTILIWILYFIIVLAIFFTIPIFRKIYETKLSIFMNRQEAIKKLRTTKFDKILEDVIYKLEKYSHYEICEEIYKRVWWDKDEVYEKVRDEWNEFFNDIKSVEELRWKLIEKSKELEKKYLK